MNAARSTKSRRDSRRTTQKSPRLECLEDRRLLTLSWTSTNLSLFGHDTGATVTPNGDFFASDGVGMKRSTDQGATWADVTGFPSFAGGAIAYAPSKPTTMIAGRSHGTIESTDGGANWFDLVDLNAGAPPRSIVFDPKNELTVYAGVGDGWGLYKSTNGGGTWTHLLSSQDVWAVGLDPTKSDILYVGVHAYADEPGGLLMTVDGGVHWTSASALNEKDVLSVLVDPSDGQRIYAGTRDNGIYESTDGGGTWKKISGSTIVAPVTTLTFDPQNSAHLIAATGGAGVFTSADGGASWAPDNDGLKDLNVVALGVQAASPFDILVVTYGGKGFWSTLSSTNSPTPTPTPTPTPIGTPISGPVTSPTPTPRPPLTPGPIVALPTPSFSAITPVPAPSPTGSGHGKSGRVVVMKPRAHHHPVIAHHKPKTTHHPKASTRGTSLAESVGL